VVLLSVVFLGIASATVHQVNVTTSNAFVPGLLYIGYGDTVVWSNQAGAASGHNVVSDAQLFRCADGCHVNASTGADAAIAVGQSGDGNSSTAAWSFNITFNAAGLYPYYCEGLGAPALSGMSGAVLVAEQQVVINREYNGLISGGDFVAIIVSVVGGAILFVVLLVVSIAAFRNREAFIAPLRRLKH
jgi:plastocyanin